MGVLDPCSGSDDIPCKPLQLSAQVPSCLGRSRFPVLNTYREGILLSRTSRFRLALRLSGPWRGVDLEAPAVSHVPCALERARVVGPLRGCSISRCGIHGGYEAPGLYLPRNKRSTLRANDAVTVLGSSHAGDGVGEECYLVDPASSHMLVSKIKPCMYKRSTRALPVAAMIHDNSTDRTASCRRRIIQISALSTFDGRIVAYYGGDG
ncbi:hypothetical protein Salat_2962000 [Sesamum alatum]|uniref:Uncharacterized protein n=1 Tax=Sesamum alatum TaxID=300844 RepID=A0AAE2C7S3_9LAMI|nr:hypothetical protein Salat_2962000 [Sesamum alatum]